LLTIEIRSSPIVINTAAGQTNFQYQITGLDAGSSYDLRLTKISNGKTASATVSTAVPTAIDATADTATSVVATRISNGSWYAERSTSGTTQGIYIFFANNGQWDRVRVTYQLGSNPSETVTRTKSGGGRSMFLAIPYSFDVQVVIEDLNGSGAVTDTRLNASFLPYSP
jgi:hypothetical protein